MKHLKLSLLTLGLAMFMWGCGGNKDADTFCDCFAKFQAGEEDACEKEMEELEEALKEDESRSKAFREAAMKKCPEAEQYINRMQ